MFVYTVEEVVDLGNHVLHVFATEEEADMYIEGRKENPIPHPESFEIYEYEVGGRDPYGLLLKEVTILPRADSDAAQ